MYRGQQYSQIYFARLHMMRTLLYSLVPNWKPHLPGFVKFSVIFWQLFFTVSLEIFLCSAFWLCFLQSGFWVYVWKIFSLITLLNTLRFLVRSGMVVCEVLLSLSVFQ